MTSENIVGFVFMLVLGFGGLYWTYPIFKELFKKKEAGG